MFKQSLLPIGTLTSIVLWTQVAHGSYIQLQAAQEPYFARIDAIDEQLDTIAYIRYEKHLQVLEDLRIAAAKKAEEEQLAREAEQARILALQEKKRQELLTQTRTKGEYEASIRRLLAAQEQRAQVRQTRIAQQQAVQNTQQQLAIEQANQTAQTRAADQQRQQQAAAQAEQVRLAQQQATAQEQRDLEARRRAEVAQQQAVQARQRQALLIQIQRQRRSRSSRAS